MKTIRHTVKDPNGIHARPAGVLVNTAKNFQSDIFASVGDKKGDCKRIFSLMGMSVKCGEELLIEISGTDEDTAFSAIIEALDSSGI